MNEFLFGIFVDGIQIHTQNSPHKVNALAHSLDIWGMDNPNVNGHFNNARALSEALMLQTGLDVRFGCGSHLVSVGKVEKVVLNSR